MRSDEEMQGSRLSGFDAAGGGVFTTTAHTNPPPSPLRGEAGGWGSPHAFTKGRERAGDPLSGPSRPGKTGCTRRGRW